jgi:protein SCO1
MAQRAATGGEEAGVGPSLVRLLAGMLFVAAAVAGSAAAVGAPKPAFVGPTIDHPSVAPDFALHDQHGALVRLDSERGKVVLITFLYTHCPDLCPVTAGNLNTALGLLGPARKHVVVLAISVDPKGDTPAAVTHFVRVHALRPEFHYLTGARSALTRIWNLYDVTPVRPNAPDPDHTLYILVLDRRGVTRVLFDSLAQPAAIAHDVRLLLPPT